MSHRDIRHLEIKAFIDSLELGTNDVQITYGLTRRVRISGFGCLQKIFKDQKTYATDRAISGAELIGRVRSGEEIDDITGEDI